MLEQMVFYAQTGYCRWKVMLDALGQTPAFDGCGHCDNCRRIAAARDQAADATPAAAERRPGTTAGAGEDAGDATTARGLNPAAIADFAAGDRVQVRRYGRGIVTEADAISVTVEFAGGQRRCFLPAFVRPAPAARGPRPAA